MMRFRGFRRVLSTSLAALMAYACGQRTDADRLAALLQIKPGTVVADVGAGKGQMTVMMAEKVGPSGHVFSTEIEPKRVKQIRRAANRAGVSNVSVVEARPADTGLPADCCDAIFMRGVYHHLTEPLAIDASLYRALRPGGEMAIQDFRPSLLLKPWTPSGIPANRGGHGVPPEIVTREVTSVGFRRAETIDPWVPSWFFSNYCLVFRKPLVSVTPQPSG
jgi:ubiquinone/menaquinone biosynthesis C-methylase UbiE